MISEPIFGLEKSASALWRSRAQKAKSALLFTHSTAELPKYQQAAVQLISVEMLSNTVNTGVFRRRAAPKRPFAINIGACTFTLKTHTPLRMAEKGSERGLISHAIYLSATCLLQSACVCVFFQPGERE